MVDNSDLYKYKAKVIRVIDGDTIEVKINVGFHLEATHQLRLLGVDTPERGEPNWKEATELVKSLVLNKEIYMQTFKDDAFGRYLADVWFVSDVFSIDQGYIRHLNNEIISSGLIKQNSKWM